MEKTETLSNRLPYGVRFATKQITSLAVGCLLARTKLFEGLPSLAVAFVAASTPSCLPAACIGSIVGVFLFSGELLPALMGAAAILACGMISFALRAVTKTRETPFSAFLVSFLCCVAAGVTTLLATGFYLSGVLLFLCDGILAGGASYFYVRALSLWKVLRRPAALDSSEVLSMMAGACALLLSLASIRIYVFVPARWISVAVILLSGFLFSEMGGGAAGILFGTAMEIACGVRGLACCYAVGGLLGGLVARHKRRLQPICMVIAGIVLPLVTQENEAVAVLVEIVGVSLIFSLLPKKTLLRLRRMFASAVNGGDSAGVSDGKLYAAARAVSEITPFLTEQQLKQGKIPGTKYMISRVQELTCSDCGKKEECWNRWMQRTTDSLTESFSFLHRKQFLSPNDLPKTLSDTCIRRNMLTAACLQAYEENCQSPYAQGMTDNLGTDPFRTASDLLSDVAQQCSDEKRFCPQESAAAAQVFRSFGIAVHSSACFVQGGRHTLTVTTQAFPSDANKTSLTAAVGKSCGLNFSMPTVTAVGENFRWSFTQVAKFRLRTGTAQHAADGRVCGDYFITFAQNGKQYFILCDGMGTGSAASADAQAAAEIFASLLRAELSFDCALRTVNEALLMREDAESVSTMDVVCVDLYTGEAEFCKAGAAASYLLRKGKPESIETPCMPIGILPNTTFTHTVRLLEKGDVVVLVSDGTCALEDGYITKSLLTFNGKSAQNLAEKILLASRKTGGSFRADDSTVMTIVVE